MQALKGYLEQLQAVAQQPHATGELSYHGALERLLRTLRPDLTLVHEPTRTVVGRPDFAILHQHAPVGYVEAEAYNADLDNLPPHAKAQTDAFRQHLENFLLTNFLEFRLYRAGQEVMRARLPQPPLAGQDHPRPRATPTSACACYTPSWTMRPRPSPMRIRWRTNSPSAPNC
jgi:hypothetical protein